MDLDSLHFGPDGLIPGIVQDRDGAVRMVAWLNRDALQRTLATGFVTFWSRSRQALWTKGETSGNRLRLIQLRPDCDADVLLILAEPEGPSCHRGTETCFDPAPGGSTGVAPWPATLPWLGRLEALLKSRKASADPAGSYTQKLFSQGVDRIAKKVVEEAGEVVIAAKNEDREAFLGEAADLLFHLDMLLLERGASLLDVVEVLHGRHAERAGGDHLMAVRTPHFPDLLFGPAARLRRWEGALMGLLEAHGYRELHPSLVLREALPEGTLRFFDGEDLVALRWDFTVALAGLLARRFPTPPARVAYAGAVFRRPVQPWEAVERFEVGCERIQPEGESSSEADLELAKLLMAIPGVLGLKSAILHLGHAALVRRPLEAEGLFGDLADEVVAALSRRAPHRVREALDGHPAAARFTAHAEALLSELNGPTTLDALQASPYAELLKDDRDHMDRALQALLPILPPNLELRVDLADVAGLGFYTGPTLRLWAPGAQQELAAGGRYDRLFPDLGRPWQAAGFCVRLSRLLDLAETRPDLFEQPQ